MIFFFNDTATTEIYTLSLHDALPIWREKVTVLWIGIIGIETHCCHRSHPTRSPRCRGHTHSGFGFWMLRSEEHTSELQSLRHLVCRLLLEKKKNSSTTKRDPTLTNH